MSFLTLRARYKESRHAEANDEALRDPNAAKVCQSFNVIRVDNSEHEKTKGDEKSSAANDLAEVPCIE